MKKEAKVYFREDLRVMSDNEINRLVTIKDSDFNRNRKYGSITKKMWKAVYNAKGPGRMTAEQIADAWGANVATVRKAVDPEFAEKVKAERVRYNKRYWMTHKNVHNTPEYRRDLIERKRKIVCSGNLEHLKTL